MIKKSFFEERRWYMNMERLQLCKHGGAVVPSRGNGQYKGPEKELAHERMPVGESSKMNSKMWEGAT